MKLQDRKLRDHYRTAYNYAYYKIGSKCHAEDIASQAVNLYILKSDSINPAKANSWIRTACLNYCRKYYTQKAKSNKMINHVQQELIDYYKTDHEQGTNNLHDKFFSAMENLSELETRTLVLYFKNEQNIKKLAEEIGENYSGLRKRIFRIKQKLKAETYRELGYIATRKIVTPHMHEAIIQFVKRLKKNIENNTIEKMFYYFSETNIKDFNPDFDINKIKDYEVLLRNGKYTIFLFYTDSQQKMNNFHFTFYLNSKKQLKILKLPEKSKKIIEFSDGSEKAEKIKELMKNTRTDHNGFIKIPSDLLEKISADN